MINLSTPSKELLDELLSDYKKADYWLTKQLGGLKKQKELGDNLCLKCLKECKELAVSEPVEYISPKGILLNALVRVLAIPLIESL